jgi:hypothetical protein
MDSPHAQPAPTASSKPTQVSPLSCLPLLGGVFIFTAIIAWISGWWAVSGNEQLVYDNMLEIARAADEFHGRFDAYPGSFEQIAEYSIMLSAPVNPYSGDPTRFIVPGIEPQPGNISLFLQNIGGQQDLIIIGYGLRPVPEAQRQAWAALPAGVDPERVLSCISVASLPDEVLHPPVEESSEAAEAAESWKTPEMK